MNAAEFNMRLRQSADAIRKAEGVYERAIEDAAHADRRYKRVDAEALVRVHEYKNADDRRAQAELLDDGHLGDVRYEAHLKAGLVNAAKLALQSRMQELSALQSLASLEKEEARFTRTEPGETSVA